MTLLATVRAAVCASRLVCVLHCQRL